MAEHGQCSSAQTARLLIVEDDVLQAWSIQHLLGEAGYETVGPARSAAAAVEAIEASALDGAILDVRLADGSAAPVAELLRQRSIPFLVLSGDSHFEAAFAGAPILSKPVSETGLLAAIQAMLRPATKCADSALKSNAQP